MEAVGVEIILKSNLETRLQKIMPMLRDMDKVFSKINQTLTVLEGNQKRAVQQFDNMNRAVKEVTRSEQGLARVSKQVGNLGGAAQSATRQVQGLNLSLKTVMASMLAMKAAQLGMEGIGFLGQSAMDFDRSAKSLQQSNLSPAIQRAVIADALRLGGSGDYAMSSNDFIRAFKETRSVSQSPEDARRNLPFIGMADMKMRLISKDLANQANVLPRYFEKFGAFDDKSKQYVTDSLLKTLQYTGGTISPAQILQQLSTSGTSVVGGDAMKEIMEQAFSIKESAAGAAGGHGGGGRGRGGVGRQAIDRIVNLGVITPAMGTNMAAGGMLEGITHQSKGKVGGTGRGNLVDQHGHPVSIFGAAHGGGNGPAGGSLNTSDVHAFLLHKRPQWMIEHANDPYQIGLDFVAGADRLGGNKIPGTFMQTRAAHIESFMKRPAAEQKALEGQLLAGSKMTGIDFLMERTIGKYMKSHDIFMQGAYGQPGLKAKGQTPVEVNLEKLTKQFESFGNALGYNTALIAIANDSLKALSDVLKILNANVTPIGNTLAYIAKLLGAGIQGQLFPTIAGDAYKAMTGAPGGAVMGTPFNAMAQLGGPPMTAAVKQTQDWVKTGIRGVKAGIHLGQMLGIIPSAPVGGLTVPPAAPYMAGSTKPDPNDMPPWTKMNAAQYDAYNSKHPASASPPAPHTTVINMNGFTDEKAIHKAAKVLAPALANRNLKAARTQSSSGSNSGGASTSKTLSGGFNQ